MRVEDCGTKKSDLVKVEIALNNEVRITFMCTHANMPQYMCSIYLYISLYLADYNAIVHRCVIRCVSSPMHQKLRPAVERWLLSSRYDSNNNTALMLYLYICYPHTHILFLYFTYLL